MAEDEIRYDLLTQDALRGVVRQVLARVQREGLPGEHHLYIAFDTGRRRRLGIEAPERAISRRDDHRPAVPVLGPASDQ